MTANHKTTFKTSPPLLGLPHFAAHKLQPQEQLSFSGLLSHVQKIRQSFIHSIEPVPSFGAICTTSPGDTHSVFHISEKIELRMCVPAVRCQEEQHLFLLASSACESTMCTFSLMQSSSCKSKQSRCGSEKDLPSTKEVDEDGGREEKKQIWHL